MSESEVLYMRSSKKNRNRSSGDSSTNEEDIWDDTLLVEAYDKAVQYAQQNCMKKKQLVKKPSVEKLKANGSESQMWKVGDRCKCQYSEDLKYYEADIIDVMDTMEMCVVKYVGYENEETIFLKDLLPSEGDFMRFRQIQQAASENGNQKNISLGNGPSNRAGKKSIKKPSMKKKESLLKNTNICPEGSEPFTSLNFAFPQVLNSIIPPPPPPHMFNISDDKNENEAMSAMLISWYMSGYHTGYYQGLKMAKKQEQ